MPKGLSWWPGCQMETVSAFHVSYGPTDIACDGTDCTTPPPEVRAFWIRVMGWSSTIRVRSWRWTSGGGGASRYAPSRRGGSLKAQCFVSPWPPCMITQRKSSQLLQ